MSFHLPRAFDPGEHALMLAMAQQCAQALERARLYREMQQAVRLRDQFLSTASHELKTPLTSVMGYADILSVRALREGNLSRRDERAVRAISAQAHQLNKLIGTMLDVSRLQSGQFILNRQPLDLRALTCRVVEEMQSFLARHTIELSVGEKAVIVNGDEVRLEQVFHNLLGNAVKYSPDGGPISIRLERREKMTCVAVADQGIGIPKEAQFRIFNRFYRASNVDGRQISGLGIGLYVVQEIVERHGGQITVESQEEEGSTFTVCLPLHSP